MSSKTMTMATPSDSSKCARLLKANKRLVQQERTVREALRAVMEWWMATPQFEAGEDEMPAHIFDKAMLALNGKPVEASNEWPSKGLL